MSQYVVGELALNLRSAPDPTKKNVLVVLAQGTPVQKVADSARPSWIEVTATVGGAAFRGFVNASLLLPADHRFPTAARQNDRLPIADLGSRPSARRSFAGAYPYSLGEPGIPAKPSSAPGGAAAGILRLIDWLDVGNPAHARWVPSGGKTFCNIYTYDVCTAAGVYIPRVWWTSRAISQLNAGQRIEAKYGDTVNEMRANFIFNWLVEYGSDFGWQRHATVDELQAAANTGRLGIICAQRTDMERPGHIQVIAPEHGANKAKRNAAGKVTQPLQSNAGAKNFRYGFMTPNWWQGANFRQFGFWSAPVA